MAGVKDVYPSDGTKHVSLSQYIAEDKLTEMQRQARAYRATGFDLQQQGDVSQARMYYQKAIELDPRFAVAYNDLGVIYESAGDISRAEQHYLKSIKLDPQYPSAYSNLAILYENRRDIERAAMYWQKRADLGPLGDRWAEKAKQRHDDILLVLGKRSIAADNEQEVYSLIKDVQRNKYVSRRDDKALAMLEFEKAKVTLRKGEDVLALRQAIDAQQLDPSNKAINDFVEKLSVRLLSR